MEGYIQELLSEANCADTVICSSLQSTDPYTGIRCWRFILEPKGGANTKGDIDEIGKEIQGRIEQAVTKLGIQAKKRRREERGG